MIDRTGSANSPAPAPVSPARTGAGKGQNQLGESDFLQLLVTQLKYQDPMQPTDDKQFIAQLAQFSALEQSQAQTKWSQMTFALGLVGRTVSFTGSDGQADSGLVKAVKVASGKPVLSIGGKDVTIEQVVSAE